MKTVEGIAKAVKKLIKQRDKAVEEELIEAMGCKPLELWRYIERVPYRDDIKRKEVVIWSYMGVPFMRCDTWMDAKDNKLKYQIGRIEDNGPKIITL